MASLQACARQRLSEVGDRLADGVNGLDAAGHGRTAAASVRTRVMRRPDQTSDPPTAETVATAEQAVSTPVCCSLMLHDRAETTPWPSGAGLSAGRRCVRDACAEQQCSDGIRRLMHCVVAGGEVVDVPPGISFEPGAEFCEGCAVPS